MSVPGVTMMDVYKHGEADCVVVYATRPIYARDEQEEVAKELGVQTEGRQVHAPHLACLNETLPAGIYLTAFYIGGNW